MTCLGKRLPYRRLRCQEVSKKCRLCGQPLAVSYQQECGMRDFRKLRVWNKSHRFALQVYGITGDFPSDERFGLSIQLRKVGASSQRISLRVAEEKLNGNLPGL